MELGFGNPRKGLQNLRDTKLGATARVIHQIVVKGLTPRMEKTSCVTAHDAYLMASILKGEQVHLPVVIMKHMESCARKESHGLPFLGLVKTLMSNAGLYEQVKEMPLSYSFSSKDGNQGTGTQEQDELRDMLSKLRSKFDENLFWMKKLFAKLSEGQGEGTSGTGPGGA